MITARLSNPRISGTRVVVTAEFLSDDKLLRTEEYNGNGGYDQLAETVRKDLEMFGKEANTLKALKEIRQRIKDDPMITLPPDEEEQTAPQEAPVVVPPVEGQ